MDLEFQIKNANSHLPEGSKLFLSLHNGPKVFVVTGAACALYGACYEFEENSCCSWPGSKQNAFLAVPFRILCPVSAPYHGMYMNEVPEKPFQEDLGGEELWQAEDYKCRFFTLRAVCFNVLFVPVRC